MSDLGAEVDSSWEACTVAGRRLRAAAMERREQESRHYWRGVKADTKAWFVCLYSEALEIHSMSFDLQSYSPPLPSASLLKRIVSEGLLGSTSVPCVPGGLAICSLGIVEDVRGGVIAADGCSSIGSSVRADCVGSSSGSLPLGSNLVVQGVETLGLGTVKVEPPVADEVVLVEDGSVGAEEAVLGEATSAIGRANVEDLALRLGVGIVSSVNLSVTGKARLGDLGIDWVIFSGDSRNGFLKHGNVVVGTCR